MPPFHPDDSSPSKSLRSVKAFINSGSETRLEVRSAYAPEGTTLMGALVLWQSYDDQKLTSRLENVTEDGSS